MIKVLQVSESHETDCGQNINLPESRSQFSRGQGSCPVGASKGELTKPGVTALWGISVAGTPLLELKTHETNWGLASDCPNVDEGNARKHTEIKESSLTSLIYTYYTTPYNTLPLAYHTLPYHSIPYQFSDCTEDFYFSELCLKRNFLNIRSEGWITHFWDAHWQTTVLFFILIYHCIAYLLTSIEHLLYFESNWMQMVLFKWVTGYPVQQSSVVFQIMML